MLHQHHISSILNINFDQLVATMIQCKEQIITVFTINEPTKARDCEVWDQWRVNNVRDGQHKSDLFKKMCSRTGQVRKQPEAINVEVQEIVHATLT